MYIHQESCLGSSQISPQSQTDFDHKAISLQRKALGLLYMTFCRAHISLDEEIKKPVEKTKFKQTILTQEKDEEQGPSKKPSYGYFHCPKKQKEPTTSMRPDTWEDRPHI